MNACTSIIAAWQGYLTSMHAYCILSTLLVVVVAFENVVAFWAAKRAAVLGDLDAAFRRVAGTEENRQKTIKVQAVVRGMLAKRNVKLAAEEAHAPLGPKQGKSSLPTNAVVPFDGTGKGGSSGRVLERIRKTPPRPQKAARHRWMRASQRRTKRLLDAVSIWSASYLDGVSFVLFSIAFAIMHAYTLFASLHLQPSNLSNAAPALPSFCYTPCDA